ncbi:hypothetical protein [Paracoccus sp. SY]|uniref:hypothetical protein n=1 Tax=Paracoccus sp. SY TaxID=1330255 RepID=UPI000CD119D8|nr:hypothetical protein [Paracoccus sp. SY]
MSAPMRGLGLMKKKSLRTAPLVITVGDVMVTITRITGSTASISVRAPRELTIDFSEGGDILKSVEAALQPVVEVKD